MMQGSYGMDPKTYYKSVQKAIKKAREAEKIADKKPETPKKKSRLENIDIAHMFLGTLVGFLFLGPWLGLVLINSWHSFAVQLSNMFK
jgi:uncharacterized membrane protein